ncbi:nucleotide exchange factor GrpE [Clostridium vitabionis]|uniref:nucleotide exchange factor GrpE n=1 Tax=Clostridium vitabionis TaxID=2784388 RepID=UPI0038B2AB86
MEIDENKQQMNTPEAAGQAPQPEAPEDGRKNPEGGKAAAGEAGNPEAGEAEKPETAKAEEKKPDEDQAGAEKSAEPKNQKKDPRDQKISELTDSLQRLYAEFDNFRKRTEKEKSAMYEIGAKDIIEKMLPILDNFERGLATVPEAEKENSFVKGMDKVYKQFLKTLDDIGVKPIEAAGKAFDPNFHNAVMHVDDENYGENIVVEELQKGYTYRDSVVRHSMVKVAN